VPHFGIAHLPVRQAHVHAGTGNQAVRVFRQDAVPVRGMGGLDGVGIGSFPMAEAVKDDQDVGLAHGGVGLAAAGKEGAYFNSTGGER